jgi:hypothetical protein
MSAAGQNRSARLAGLSWATHIYRVCKLGQADLRPNNLNRRLGDPHFRPYNDKRKVRPRYAKTILAHYIPNLPALEVKIS